MTSISQHLEEIRRSELEVLLPYIKPKCRLLEIGGSNGFQASIIASWQADVASIDIKDHSISGTHYFPVQQYNGMDIPFPDQSFDLIFSSNVLEHVDQLPHLLQEMRRVMKPEALAIHLVPSSSWRFWTLLSHYAYIAKRAIERVAGRPDAEQDLSLGKIAKEKGVGYTIKRIAFPRAHGHSANALIEIADFTQRSWTRIFQKNGFRILQISKNNLFYTGYSLFPNLGIEIRRTMAPLLGSSCNVFILQKESE